MCRVFDPLLVAALGHRSDLFPFQAVFRLPRYGNDHAHTVEYGIRCVKMDPLVVLTCMGMATERLGLGATASTTYFEPFDVARRFQTLDLMTGGRAAWNVVTSLNDGEALILGGVSLTARITPGHTRGCTSWTMTAGGHDILFFCSATVAGNRLANPPQYEGIVADYRATFDRTRAWRPDIFLSNHPEFFDMEERLARQVAGDERAFVDAEAFQTLIGALEDAFEQALVEQTAAASGE